MNDSTLVTSAGRLAFLVGIIALALKFWCYELTNSQIVLSDALESIVNVAAAGFTFFVLRVAAVPPDEKHPYGHGKTEFFSAAFEGGLISFAAVMILIGSGHALWSGHTVHQLEFGVLVIAAAGAVNLLLGTYVLRVGRNSHSVSLEASGHHILSDVWTTAAALIGLLLMSLTGLTWIDPLLGLGAGFYLGLTGLRIFRGSIGGLLDEGNRDVLSHLADAINVVRKPGIIGVHGARIMRSGNYHYIDAHVVVPEFWDVLYSHDQVNAFERATMQQYRYSGEVHFHIDPCRRAYCKKCDLSSCAIRQAAFQSPIAHTLSEVVANSSSRD